MHSVMKLTLSKLMSGRSPGELSAGLKQLLKHYVYLQGTQGNQKKVPSSLIPRLLFPPPMWPGYEANHKSCIYIHMYVPL